VFKSWPVDILSNPEGVLAKKQRFVILIFRAINRHLVLKFSAWVKISPWGYRKGIFLTIHNLAKKLSKNSMLALWKLNFGSKSHFSRDIRRWRFSPPRCGFQPKSRFPLKNTPKWPIFGVWARTPKWNLGVTSRIFSRFWCTMQNFGPVGSFWQKTWFRFGRPKISQAEMSIKTFFFYGNRESKKCWLRLFPFFHGSVARIKKLRLVLTEKKATILILAMRKKLFM